MLDYPMPRTDDAVLGRFLSGFSVSKRRLRECPSYEGAIQVVPAIDLLRGETHSKKGMRLFRLVGPIFSIFRTLFS